MSRYAYCACGRRWSVHSHRASYATVCRTCRQFAAPPRRQPTLGEWRELATDREVAAGAAAYARGVRNPLTAAMRDEHRARRLEGSAA